MGDKGGISGDAVCKDLTGELLQDSRGIFRRHRLEAIVQDAIMDGLPGIREVGISGHDDKAGPHACLPCLSQQLQAGDTRHPYIHESSIDVLLFQKLQCLLRVGDGVHLRKAVFLPGKGIPQRYQSQLFIVYQQYSEQINHPCLYCSKFSGGCKEDSAACPAALRHIWREIRTRNVKFTQNVQKIFYCEKNIEMIRCMSKRTHHSFPDILTGRGLCGRRTCIWDLG
jgi:hypothetical protein